jgi:hypothetical protein
VVPENTLLPLKVLLALSRGIVAPEVPVFTVAEVPKPRFVRAVGASLRSERLLAGRRAAMVVHKRVEPSLLRNFPVFPLRAGMTISTVTASVRSIHRAGSVPEIGAGRFKIRYESISILAPISFGEVPSRLRVFSIAASIAALFSAMA